jgi:hypothetical protein
MIDWMASRKCALSEEKVEHLIDVHPVEGTTYVYSDFSMTVTFGKQMREIYDKVLSESAGLSEFDRAGAVLELVLDAFEKPRKEKNRTLDEALRNKSGACLEEALVGCLVLDRREDGTLKKEYSVACGYTKAIEKSKFLKREKLETRCHAWVEGKGLIIDFGLNMIAVSVACPGGVSMVFSDETIPEALECHRRIYSRFEDELKKDSEAWKKVKRRDLEEAKRFREVRNCHLRIRDNFFKMVTDLSRKKEENPLMPIIYDKKSQKIKVEQPAKVQC